MARREPLIYGWKLTLDLHYLSATSPGTQHILVEEGKNNRRLVIAFTGFQGALTMRPFDFFSVTGMLDSSRILLRDPSQQLYLSGCGEEAPDFDSLLARLKREVDRLSPEWITCIGTSSGGYAAMLFGHLLPADEVHAFAPNVRASAWSALFRRDWDSLLNEAKVSHFFRQAVLPRRLWKYFDLRSALRQWNGRTRFVVHFCEQNARDARRADLLRGTPHVELAGYPCRTHQVAKYLVRENRLAGLFSRPAELPSDS